ncbi:MAG: NADPH-dependent F420 reductase [Bryobacteraceae bacterium]
MKIGVLGSGNVGGTLGRRWAQGGHTVVFGTRRPESDEVQALLAQAGPNARAASSIDAVAASDVVLVSTPWPATKEIVTACGSLAGKIVVDATNPLLPSLAGMEVGTTTSGAEMVAGWAPGATVVKAFNTIGSNVMADAAFGAEKALMFYCGDDAAAKAVVGELAAELGFDARDAGPLTQARLLEPLALLWISLAFAGGYGREFAFQILRRNAS